MELTNGEVVARSAALMKTYGRWPVAMVRGEGVWLWDADGRRYLDFAGGIAVTVLGHSHPAVAEAIADQARTLLHCSNLYYIPQQVELANWLAGHSALDQAFFCNSGAEANEAAIKLARRWAYHNGAPGRSTVVTLEHSFHGRTLGALTATAQPRYQEGFGPLLGGVRHVPAGDLEALETALDGTVCAVMMEMVQGEAGVIPLQREYVRKVRDLCDRRGILLIIDEVQTGMGRTGTFFAYEQYRVEPDICTLAKGLANGVPVGAVLAKRAVAEAFGPGTHGSTFGGNPLAMRAALATVQVVEKERLWEKAARRGEYLRSRLSESLGQHPRVRGIRGLGLMLGLVLDQSAAPVAEACLEKGLLVTLAGGNTIRLLPALIVEEREIDDAVARLAAAFNQVFGGP
ncbi:MAG: acetylornithine transaminase [Kyrpidia sp.]|nr:acetylornithine transaminase [Kyrpidia sp.]